MSPCVAPLQSPVAMERRQWKRTSVSQEAFCQFKNGSNEEAFLTGEVVNVSRGGMGILSSQRIEPGTAFRIGIADGTDGPFTLLSSRVVRVAPAPGQKWFVGCAFTPKLREDILAWIERLGALNPAGWGDAERTL